VSSQSGRVASRVSGAARSRQLPPRSPSLAAALLRRVGRTLDLAAPLTRLATRPLWLLTALLRRVGRTLALAALLMRISAWRTRFLR